MSYNLELEEVISQLEGAFMLRFKITKGFGLNLPKGSLFELTHQAYSNGFSPSHFALLSETSEKRVGDKLRMMIYNSHCSVSLPYE